MKYLAASVLTCCLALSLTACGGGRGYAVPKKACGVPLNEKKIDPFLVDGKELKVVGDSLIDTKGKSQGRCEISVGDWLVANLEVDKVDKLYDPMGDLDSFRFRNREKIKNLPFEGLGAVGDYNAMVSTGCAAPTADHLVVLVTISLKSGGDVAERRKHIKAFTIDFVPKVKKALGCTA
ncbi:hypothetical protein ACNPQM_31095 [Streptomyces sp. NPDC056231]|uniref:hypothetical protein n=1 Tax=Streptomyces sp. NPDC056231 TaxID=3345755 RepID=UPI003AAE79BC